MVFPMHRIALVIPTKDRPADLRTMLASLAIQTYLPQQIVVVDGSNPPIEQVIAEFPNLSVDYVRVFPPSLAKQRNAGMARLGPDISLAGYLDDDVVLEPSALENMMLFWESADPETGGAAFNIVNNPMPGLTSIKRFFFIDHPIPGLMLPSGFPSTICNLSRNIDTEWLYGGATVWRRTVIENFPYDEWFVGTGFMEDVDYSYNVRSKFKLKIVADARLAHYSRPVRNDRQKLLGTWQVINRMYFVRKYSDRGMSLPAAWWASLGLLLLNAGLSVARLDYRYLNRAIGNAMGICSELLGRHPQLGGHLK